MRARTTKRGSDHPLGQFFFFHNLRSARHVVTKGFTVSANYNRVIGFEITNTSDNDREGVGVYVNGSFNEVAANYIHDARQGVIVNSQ